jgi:uncharacterized protein (TIGR02453 family)
MLHSTTVKFLKDLRKNNNKAWFDNNRKYYEDAKKDFEGLIQAVIDKQGKNDKLIAGLKAKECLFRINRDIRFSKDKTPYKTNLGASINRGGKKSLFAGYYFHCEPGESFVGGGLWVPMPPELKKVRQEIDYNFAEFKKIISNKKFRTVYGDLYKGQDATLSKLPHGFEKDNPAADYIKLKSFIAMKKLNETELGSKELVKTITGAFTALQPLLEFINRSLESE